VPPEAVHAQAELALAATALGWPSGHFLLWPGTRETANSALAHCVERLRWLFAGSLDLIVANVEPSAAPLPIELREPAEEWAVVRRYIDLQGTPDSNGFSCRPTRSADLRVTRAALVPRSPVVFCHGMLAFSMLRMQLPQDLNCFSPLREFLV